MKKLALDHATERLKRARQLYGEMTRQVETMAEFEGFWADFLMVCSTVYTKLEQGSKDDSKSKEWFGRKKHERRTDPLLSYLWHARNVYHHGLAQITSWTPGAYEIFPAPNKPPEPFIDQFGRQDYILRGDAKIRIVGWAAELMTVKDGRSGKSFAPPEVHLGTAISPARQPQEVARLMLVYMEGLLAEASNLPIEYRS